MSLPWYKPSEGTIQLEKTNKSLKETHRMVKWLIQYHAKSREKLIYLHPTWCSALFSGQSCPQTFSSPSGFTTASYMAVIHKETSTCMFTPL